MVRSVVTDYKTYILKHVELIWLDNSYITCRPNFTGQLIYSYMQT